MIKLFIIALCCVTLIFSVWAIKKASALKDAANAITIEKSNRQDELKAEIAELEKQKSSVLNDYNNIINQQRVYSQQCYSEKKMLEEDFSKYKQRLEEARENYITTIEQQYKQTEKRYDNEINDFQKIKEEHANELKTYKDEIQKMKNSLSAQAQAALRKQEQQNNLDFYKLSVNSIDLEDIVKLNTIKLALHQPIILSKLIWTTYFQKQTTELCNRVVGVNKICGIYKITNIKTDQSYVGQSVDIAQRFKDHIKCGLGIEAPSTNKLYNAMQNCGVWNFTFEVLEQCPKELLNEKEKFWIDTYQTYQYGYNSTKGNK